MNVSFNIIADPVKKICYILCFSFTVLKKGKKKLWIRLKLQKNPPSCYICDRQSRLYRLRKKRKRKKRLRGKKREKKTLNDLPQRKNFLNVHLGEQQFTADLAKFLAKVKTCGYSSDRARPLRNWSECQFYKREKPQVNQQPRQVWDCLCRAVLANAI